MLCDQMLDDDVSHAVPISIAILVEAVNCTESKLIASNGPILTAQHLDKKDNNVAVHLISTSKKRLREWENVPVVRGCTQQR